MSIFRYFKNKRTECPICLDNINIFGKLSGQTTMCCKQRYHSNCLRQWYIEHNLCPSCNTVKVKCFLFKDNLISINTDRLIWKNNISIIKIDLCNIRCIIQLNNGNINIISSDLKGDMTFNLEAPDKIIMNKIYHSIVHLHNNIR